MRNNLNRVSLILLDGFTLIELITVVIIISILVSISVPLYTRTVERARDREAIANLQLILAAERIYHLEYGSYYPAFVGQVAGVAEINTNLRLDLNDSVWTYTVRYVSASGFLARAERTVWLSRTYSINENDISPSCSGDGCP